MNKADAGAWAAVSKVPREHLARSLLLLQLCRDLRVQEHDETNRGIIHQFVDEACSHINTLAVNARQCKETPDGNYFQEEWDQIWKLVHDLGPSIHPPEIFQKVREAQQKDSVIKDKLIDISGKIQRFKARLTAKDITILVAGPKLGMTIHEHIKVKKRTPPRGLSAAIMFSKPDIVGKSFDLYPVDGWAPGQKPATWNDNEETPSHLFLISDRGHFRFRAPISTIWVDFSPFRNIVSFKRGSHTITFLKDCFGELREHPDKKVIDNRPVYCWRANQDTSTRVESWRELIAALVDHLDENWTIKDINLPPPPHAPFAILGTSTLSSLLSQADEDRDQDSSGTDRHPNKWSIGSWTSRGTNTSMYGSRLSAAGQDQPKGVSAGKMRLSPLVPFTEDSEAPLSDTSSSSRPTNPNRRTHARPIVMEHYSDSPISRPPSAFNSGLSNTMNVDPHKSAALVPSSATGALSIITAGAKEDEDYTGGIGEISTESSAVFHTIDAPSTAAIQQTRIGSSRGAHSMESRSNQNLLINAKEPDSNDLSDQIHDAAHQPSPVLEAAPPPERSAPLRHSQSSFRNGEGDISGSTYKLSNLSSSGPLDPSVVASERPQAFATDPLITAATHTERQETSARMREHPDVPTTDDNLLIPSAVDITLSPSVQQPAHVPNPRSDPNPVITTPITPAQGLSVPVDMEDSTRHAVSVSPDGNRRPNEVRSTHIRAASTTTFSTQRSHGEASSSYLTPHDSAKLRTPSSTRPTSIQGSTSTPRQSISSDRRLTLTPSYGNAPTSGIAAAMLRASMVSSMIVAEGESAPPPLSPPQPKKRGLFKKVKDIFTEK